MEKKKIKGIIFDKDGTLFNYAEVWGPSIKDYTDTLLKTFRLKEPEKARQEIYEIVGIDDCGNTYPDGFLFHHSNLVRIFFKLLFFCLQNSINPFRMRELMSGFINRKNAKILHKLSSMDFSRLQEIFKRLCEDGIVLGLVTNDIIINTKLCLDIMGIDKYISFIRTKDSNCKRKPNVQSIKQFASAFGLERSEIAVIGDSIIDMKYAKAGNVGYTIAVMTGYGERSKLEKYTPVIYNRIEDIEKDPVLFADDL